MMERDERESEGADVCPEEKFSPEVVGETPREPKLFGELGAGVTEQERVVSGEAREGDADVPEAEDEAEPVPPVLTGRRKGGVFRRVVEGEPQVEGASLSGEQRLLILDAWARSELTAGAFGKIAGVSAHTLYAWKKRFELLGTEPYQFRSAYDLHRKRECAERGIASWQRHAYRLRASIDRVALS